jgi:hypothetical protein
MSLYACMQGRLPLVVEGLLEFDRGSPDIAEVDEEDLLLLAELANRTRQVIRHEGDVALAQTDPIHFALHEISFDAGSFPQNA